MADSSCCPWTVVGSGLYNMHNRRFPGSLPDVLHLSRIPYLRVAGTDHRAYQLVLFQ